MTSVIVKVVDGLICHQVLVVEEETIDAQAVSELQFVVNVPFVLSINAKFIELYASSRLRLTIIAIGQGNNLRSAIKQHLCIEDAILPHSLSSVEAIVASTITHIHIVSHLMLIAYTSHNLMIVTIIGHIILDIPDGVMNGIVPGEQLIAQRDIVVVIFRNIDEREWR